MSAARRNTFPWKNESKSETIKKTVTEISVTAFSFYFVLMTGGATLQFYSAAVEELVLVVLLVEMV